MSLHEAAAAGNLANVEKALRRGEKIDGRNADGETPLMVAARSDCADANLIRRLIELGADPNASAPKNKNRTRATSVLLNAAAAGSLEKVAALVEAGADVRYVDDKGYSLLLHTLYSQLGTPDRDLFPLMNYLVRHGAILNAASTHGESLLTVSSNRGRFSWIKFFLDRGADPSPLQWNPLFHAVVFGSLDEVRDTIVGAVDLECRDHWNRTPLLLSIHAGRRDVAALLLEHGSDLAARGRCGMTAAMLAIASGDAKMLRWLVAAGADVHASDDFDNLPIHMASTEESAECVRILLDAGASPHALDSYGHAPIHAASHPAVIDALVNAGANLSDLQEEGRTALVGGCYGAEPAVNEADYRRWRTRRFGRQNPERMNNPFWEEMIRTRATAYKAGQLFGEDSLHAEPIWCFHRFGQSLTRLPDGGYVEIGGEHEDFYDPDFCIYNDVVVHRPDGSLEIFGYPEATFPPTDFHSATLHDRFVYIIGSLGYHDQRRPGFTPVFRLDCDNWRIEQANTYGEAPGWIFKHNARLVSTNQIEISGGQVIEDIDADPRDNAAIYVLNLETLVWRRTNCSSAKPQP